MLLCCVTSKLCLICCVCCVWWVCVWYALIDMMCWCVCCCVKTVMCDNDCIHSVCLMRLLWWCVCCVCKWIVYIMCMMYVCDVVSMCDCVWMFDCVVWHVRIQWCYILIVMFDVCWRVECLVLIQLMYDVTMICIQANK